MSEQPITARTREPVSLHVGKLREVRARELLVRFAFGAITSAVAGGITIAFGSRAGGIFLAFPAVLAATVTLIQTEEGSADARESALGAVVGAFALTAFAAVGAALFGELPGAGVLCVASVAWAVIAVGLYFALWRRR